VVEPAKAEYRLMAARLPGTEVIRIRPGDLQDPPAGIGPLEPTPDRNGARFPRQTHADLVRALFLAAFEADEPFPRSWRPVEAPYWISSAATRSSGRE
jgi:hypothetical protein